MPVARVIELRLSRGWLVGAWQAAWRRLCYGRNLPPARQQQLSADEGLPAGGLGASTPGTTRCRRPDQPRLLDQRPSAHSDQAVHRLTTRPPLYDSR